MEVADNDKKVVQITAVSHNLYTPMILALRSDGAIFSLDVGNGKKWIRLADIPKD